MEGSSFTIDTDTMITAIGEASDLGFLPQEIPSREGLIQTDEMGFIHVRGYFAGGDAATLDRTVAVAIGSGKKAALAIHEYLQGSWSTKRFESIRVGGKGTISAKKYFHPPKGETNPPVMTFKEINTDYFEHHGRVSDPSLSLEERRGTFHEIHLGLTREMVKETAVDFAESLYCGPGGVPSRSHTRPVTRLESNSVLEAANDLVMALPEPVELILTPPLY